jgi:hypothetical protein
MTETFLQRFISGDDVVLLYDCARDHLLVIVYRAWGPFILALCAAGVADDDPGPRHNAITNRGHDQCSELTNANAKQQTSWHADLHSYAGR